MSTEPKEFREVAGEALDEAREKFEKAWIRPDLHRDAVNFALGLYASIVMRRMRGLPDRSGRQRLGGSMRDPDTRALSTERERRRYALLQAATGLMQPGLIRFPEARDVRLAVDAAEILLAEIEKREDPTHGKDSEAR